jgi:hypothetical protein
MDDLIGPLTGISVGFWILFILKSRELEKRLAAIEERLNRDDSAPAYD